jgi:uncharacterized protein
MKHKKLPQRTCIGCREVKSKRELIRIVRTPDGSIVMDPSGKANGRGAYVCPRTDCFQTALNSKRLSKALNAEIDENDVSRIKRDLRQSLKESTDE